MDRIGLSINTRSETSDEELIAIAKLADEQGYHSFWAAESWGRDAFTILAMIACNTQNIGLATGIVNVFSRTPALIAQSIASLDIMSKGRAILGLGSIGKSWSRGGTAYLSIFPWAEPVNTSRSSARL